MLQGPTNILKSQQSSTICKKYVSNLMNIFVNFFLKHIWLNGGPVGGGGASTIRLGPSWFTYPPFNNNLHVKYRSNLIRTF